MSPTRQHMDGPNGSYNICSECGEKFGAMQSPVFGQWTGQCDICGAATALSNALHDWGMLDAECSAAAQSLNLNDKSESECKRVQFLTSAATKEQQRR
jgi:hypothetical protein